MAKGHAITINDESGNPVRVTEVTINHPPIISNMDAEPDNTIAYGCETEDTIHDDIVVPAKSDSDIMFVYKVIRDLESIDHLCINPIHRIGLIHK